MSTTRVKTRKKTAKKVTRKTKKKASKKAQTRVSARKKVQKKSTAKTTARKKAAKKKATKKTATRKTAKKVAKKAAKKTRKKTASKASRKKTTRKVTKKVTKKAATKKTTAKKATRKVTKKAAGKKATRKAAKKVTRKVASKKTAKKTTKKATTTTGAKATPSGANPLLASGLADFAKIKPAHVIPALDAVLKEGRALIKTLEKIERPGWDNFCAPLEELDDRLSRMWAPISHLNAVRDSDALRKAYDDALPKLTEWSTQVGQNEKLAAAYRRVAEGREFNGLSVAQKRIVNNAIRDFKLSGVDLPKDDKARYMELSQELSTLSNEFSKNVLDATQGWHMDVEDESRLAGIPQSALDLAKQTAEQNDVDGWRFTLDYPSFGPMVTYCDDPKLRRQMYEAYVTRASDQGPNAGEWDNTEIIRKILGLRQEMAKLVGFDNYAEYSLATKMAESSREVVSFIRDLASKSKAQAKDEFKEISEFATEEFGKLVLNAWDLGYYAEKLREQRYAFTDEEVKPYFPVDKVLDGMFEIVGRLFGIKVKAAKGASTWHEDVQFFEIVDADNTVLANFYIDLYARENKRGGAWMAGALGRYRHAEGVQKPVAFLTCNFSPPVGKKPALLTHGEVTTLFHEFGHGLHHTLTKIDYLGVSGISGVAWDAVELPSQFLENWCWEREALELISGHYKTGKPLPKKLLEKMRAARNYQAAMQMVRQLEFSLFDIQLHADYNPQGSRTVQSVLDDVRNEVAVVPAPKFNRFQNGFGHIFAGGYAAGYYSYKWAEVLSADAYSRFEENGIFDKKTGSEFRQTILEKGGSEDPMDLFVAFRGRKPSVDALLRHSGLTSA